MYVCMYVYPGGGLETGFTSLQSALNYSGSSHPGLQLGGGGLPRVNLKDRVPYFPLTAACAVKGVPGRVVWRSPGSPCQQRRVCQAGTLATTKAGGGKHQPPCRSEAAGQVSERRTSVSKGTFFPYGIIPRSGLNAQCPRPWQHTATSDLACLLCLYFSRAMGLYLQSRARVSRCRPSAGGRPCAEIVSTRLASLCFMFQLLTSASRN